MKECFRARLVFGSIVHYKEGISVHLMSLMKALIESSQAIITLIRPDDHTHPLALYRRFKTVREFLLCFSAVSSPLLCGAAVTFSECVCVFLL